MKNLFSMGIVLPLLLVLLNSCEKTEEEQKPDIILATSPTLGQYFTNKSGLTLYMFANDADGVNTCTGGCESLWPVFYVDLTIAKLDNGLNASDFATITTASNKNQLTYKGYPLYTYSPSAAGSAVNTPESAGETRGEGIGGVWFVAKTNYTIMLANKQLTGADGNNYKSDYTTGTARTIYFSDGKGRTIYTFSNDSLNVNKFTRPDFSNNAVWPVYEQEQIVVPSTLDKSLFGVITVFGRKQMTYKGWPLYYFGQDTQRGQNKGVSFPRPGVWPVAVKDIADPKKK